MGSSIPGPAVLDQNFERDFLEPAAFHELLTQEHGVEFYTGAPDSLLKNYCAFRHLHPMVH